MSHPANPPPYDAVYAQGAQPHVYPVQTQPTGHVIVQVPTHPMYNNMDIGPSTVICKTCNHLVNTRIEIRPTLRTHACALCLCVFGLWPCCFVPYCIPSCNNVDHYCPTCNTYIGAYTG